ncbi:RNA polymerase sigma factor [Ilumatobacter sp.]|uniref:RNA polymerase sigma factor n=1 Tax=Ilumatobacter sp. TaxID=1967498 RepID=UPI003B51F183
MNEVSIEEAYGAHAGDLVRYAHVLVGGSAAADVVADTFADLLQHPNGAWASAQDPRAFLFGAVANRARMHHRTNGRRRRREQLAARQRATEADADADLHRVLPAELDDLSVQQRAVTYLTYWHDLSVPQVAETLGVADGTVQRQLARARDRMRGAMS